MTAPWAVFRAGASALGVTVDSRLEHQAQVYLQELGRWNRLSRLTGYRTENERVVHLLLDSLLFLQVLPAPAPPLLDLGSGPGVPGLILKLARPDWAVTLVEANRRRANFLRHVARELGLEGVTVEEGRAEALRALPTLAGRFQTVTMRAVANLVQALPLARPFVAPGGHLVLSLGPRPGPVAGQLRLADLVAPEVGLRLRRRFLIIPSREWPADVPRGTGRERGPDPGRGQSKGGGREDDDGGQPGRRPRRG